jgi:hypothetical protein
MTSFASYCFQLSLRASTIINQATIEEGGIISKDQGIQILWNLEVTKL